MELQEALRVVTEAVKEDTAGNVERAVDLYEQSKGLLEKALIVERDAERKNLIREKIKVYSTRSEQLKDILAKKQVTERMSKLGVGTLPSLQNPKHSTTTSTATTPTSTATVSLHASAPSPSAPSPSAPPTTSTPLAYSAPTAVIESSPTKQQQQQQQQQHVVEWKLPNFKPPQLMTKSEAFQTANDILEIAKSEDSAYRYENALTAYKAALDYFMKALQDESNPELKKKIGDKMRPFLDRAEKLTTAVEYLKQQAQQNPYFQQQTCSYCKKAILINEDYKISQENVYHPKCFDLTIGLNKEETKHFLGSKDPLILKVVIPKKVFQSGEEFVYQIHVDNQTSHKVSYVAAYVLKTETIMQTVVGGPYGVERKPRSRETKLGQKKYYGVNNQFPMERGVVDVKEARFTIPTNLDPSEMAGPTATFVREYEFIVKCKLSKPFDDLKIAFPITITK